MEKLNDTSTAIDVSLPAVSPDNQRESHASLLILHGSHMGFSFPLTQERILIGRSSECDIRIDDENISRRHAEVRKIGELFKVRDLGSTNGTYINSRRIVEEKLEDGDLLIINRAVMKFVSSTSIENHVFDQMYTMITTDFLTKLFNRRHLMNVLAEEFSRARRHGRLLSVLIYDIDNFKTINDTFGHPAGDELLVASSELIASHLRREDLYARFGGDEFCLVCPETSLSQVLTLAERIRTLIANTDFTYINAEIEVSISIGVAELTNETKSADQLLQKADEALYRAKTGGKNRICS